MNVLYKAFSFADISHVAKKLVRVIFHLQRTGETFLGVVGKLKIIM